MRVCMGEKAAPLGMDRKKDKSKCKCKKAKAKTNAGVLRFAQNDKQRQRQRQRQKQKQRQEQKATATATAKAATAVDLGLLEVVDAVVFGLGDVEEGAVAELGWEADAVVGVGPGLQVAGEERLVVLGIAVVIVVGEVAAGDRDDCGAFRPRFGDGWTDVGPGAFHGGAFGDLQDFFEWGSCAHL